ncbi:MAG: Rieske (2Fe-2S) protein [Lautropia sp.]
MSNGVDAGGGAADDAAAEGRSEAHGPAAANGWRRICDSHALTDGGDGVAFDLAERPGAGGSRWRERAFVVRAGGEVRGFVNRCAHVPIELDWLPGRFFDDTGTVLLCSMHGAAYDPTSGRCLDGPCHGRGHLQPVPVRERDGVVWLTTCSPAENEPR